MALYSLIEGLYSYKVLHSIPSIAVHITAYVLPTELILVYEIYTPQGRALYSYEDQYWCLKHLRIATQHPTSWSYVTGFNEYVPFQCR